jgi:hypothetical protein
MAHEFQHKLYSDHGMPSRLVDPFGGNYNWLNEGLSQLDIHLCGYTVNSGRIVPWAIDGQLTDYLANVNLSAVCMDGNDQFPIAQQTQYGNGFLFFLYMYEHYNSGVGKRIYELGESGENDYIKLIEAGAQFTEIVPGADGEVGTPDDQAALFHDSFENLYTKFMIANFIDGIYKENTGKRPAVPLQHPRPARYGQPGNRHDRAAGRPHRCIPPGRRVSGPVDRPQGDPLGLRLRLQQRRRARLELMIFSDRFSMFRFGQLQRADQQVGHYGGHHPNY